jgi:hypothetical protein
MDLKPSFSTESDSAPPLCDDCAVRRIIGINLPALQFRNPQLRRPRARYAQEQLDRRGVEVLLKITSYDGREVLLDNNTRIATRMFIWTAGNTPAPLLSTLHCTTQPERPDPLRAGVPLEAQRSSYAAVPGFFPRLETCHSLQCCYSPLQDRLRTADEACRPIPRR